MVVVDRLGTSSSDSVNVGISALGILVAVVLVIATISGVVPSRVVTMMVVGVLPPSSASVVKMWLVVGGAKGKVTLV